MQGSRILRERSVGLQEKEVQKCAEGIFYQKLRRASIGANFYTDKKFVIPVQKANFEESFIYGIED